MREGLADVLVCMTSRPIRFIRLVIGNGQLGFSEEFKRFYGLCSSLYLASNLESLSLQLKKKQKAGRKRR